MTKLDRETVIQAALELLNEVGVDNLTTRKLAERLEVQQPALYWHFRNKRALLDALSEAMLETNHTRTVPQTGEDWCVFLKENALSFRKALLSYRDGARIHAGTRPTSAQYERVEKQIRFLCESGFEQSDAVRALVIVSHYTTGSVSEQQAALEDSSERKQASKEAPAQPSEFLSHAFDTFDAEGADFAFEYGLDALISGLEMKKTTK